MGNCTSKKSEKLLKVTSVKKSVQFKMDRDQDNNNSKGLSKKIAPFTKGEITSFGFRKKPNSSILIPVTLTSSGNAIRNSEDKKLQNGSLPNKEITDDRQSGSSIESLCHNPSTRLTPKMMRKKDLAKQTINSTVRNINNNNPNLSNENLIKNSNSEGNRVSLSTINSSVHNIVVNQSKSVNNNQNNSLNVPPANRFGFRQTIPTRLSDQTGKNSKSDSHSYTQEKRLMNNLGPYDTGTYKVVKKNESIRSKSEGPREAFFKQTLQLAGSVQSILSQSKSNVSIIPQPGKFTLQTSHLPRPQLPVRMPDTKTAKTVTNYYRRGGPQSDSNSSKEESFNDDSGFESQSITNSSKHSESFESPGYNVRRRLQSAHGKKLEMKIVGNKFELLDKTEEKDSNVVTEVSLVKLPTVGVKSGTTVINTGLVEQRTNEYLKRISQNNKKEYSSKPAESSRFRIQTQLQDSSSDSSHIDEGFGAESEEEKLYKDRNGSEKATINYLMNDGCEDDDMLPGEAMIEDISLSFSSDDETSTIAVRKKPTTVPAINLKSDVTPNTIRLDALKLSKQLKTGKTFMISGGTAKKLAKKDDSSSEMGEPDDEETFLNESIFEHLSSDSDSFEGKEKSKNSDSKKTLKNIDDVLEIKDIEDEIEEKKNIDLEISNLELNVDEKEFSMNEINGSLEPATPESPGTPTNASNSLSLSEGRDFLIDDEIADQPELCFTETYPDCSCQEDVKTCNDKTLISCGNNEFLSCAETGVNTLYKNESTQAASDTDDDDDEMKNIEFNCAVNGSPAKRERRLNSAGTLSPCNSLTSDDLMLDFESSACDETCERIQSVNGSAKLDDLAVCRNSEDSFKELRLVSSQKSNSGMGGGVLVKSRGESSTPGSPGSYETASTGASSPLRSFRPGASAEDSMKIDKSSYENMFQDIAGIKKMLLKLRQVLSESEGNEGRENGSKIHGNGNNNIDSIDEMSDLRRQVTFLQQQLEEREKMVQNLQLEISKNCESNGASETRERCNAATQTDKVKPIFTGSSALQSLPSDSGNLVSNHFTSSETPNSARNQNTRMGMIRDNDEANEKKPGILDKSPHVEKIMKKLKELSFKPVEVLEREEALRDENAKNAKLTTNGLLSNHPIFNHLDVSESENCRKTSKNVFKITKIDLVLKSDNYGKGQINRSNR